MTRLLIGSYCGEGDPATKSFTDGKTSEELLDLLDTGIDGSLNRGELKAVVHALMRPIAKHAIPALRGLATKPCHRSNCGTVCLCDSCHARKALETLDPTWRP